MAPEVAPEVAPEKVPLSALHQRRARDTANDSATRTAVDPPARIGPWLPVCTLADLLSRFARGLDTRRCPVSLLPGSLWAVR
jgi:hypothetical protein